MKPILLIVAGANGSGKITFINCHKTVSTSILSIIILYNKAKLL